MCDSERAGAARSSVRVARSAWLSVHSVVGGSIGGRSEVAELDEGESLGWISTLWGLQQKKLTTSGRNLNAMSQTISPIELLTIEEAARWCHISPNTLNYLRLQRRFAPAIRVGRRVFFKPSDLNDWLEAQREVLE
jgi:hypothetical protein